MPTRGQHGTTRAEQVEYFFPSFLAHPRSKTLTTTNLISGSIKTLKFGASSMMLSRPASLAATTGVFLFQVLSGHRVEGNQFLDDFGNVHVLFDEPRIVASATTASSLLHLGMSAHNTVHFFISNSRRSHRNRALQIIPMSSPIHSLPENAGKVCRSTG